MYSTATTTADHGGDSSASIAPITSIHPDIIQSNILTRLDGTTLAAASCASLQLNSISTDDHLWQNICNATWPSTADPTVRAAISAFPSRHRSFYADSFPSSRPDPSLVGPRPLPDTSSLVSAVDIFYDDRLIYSKALETDTLSGLFLCSPFCLDLLDRRETVPTPIGFDGDEGACMARAVEKLRVSWILIDPSRNRAVNVASGRAVEARWEWLAEEMHLRYATVVAGDEMVMCDVAVSCGGRPEGGELRMREVSLQMEDADGRVLTGLDGLKVIDAAMGGRRSRVDGGVERGDYEKFVGRKMECRERKEVRDGSWDVVVIAAGVSVLVAVWNFFSVRLIN